jgi:putative transposase
MSSTGNNRHVVFHKGGDYQAFLRMMGGAQEHVPMRILAYCLMPNHFHLVLWPESIRSLSAYMCRLMNAHVRNHHRHYGTCGHGHIWQGRFKNFPIEHDAHLLRVLRYVEANPLRARLVRRAEAWKWSSLARPGADLPELSPWPVPRPEHWEDYVNASLSADELRDLRTSVRRGAPFGEKGWRDAVAGQSGLEFTLRPPGRPRKAPRLGEAVVSAT